MSVETTFTLVVGILMAIIGYLLSRQVTSYDERLKQREIEAKEQDDRIDRLEDRQNYILTHLGLKRPSDVLKTVRPPPEGHSA